MIPTAHPEHPESLEPLEPLEYLQDLQDLPRRISSKTEPEATIAAKKGARAERTQPWMAGGSCLCLMTQGYALGSSRQRGRLDGFTLGLRASKLRANTRWNVKRPESITTCESAFG